MMDDSTLDLETSGLLRVGGLLQSALHDSGNSRDGDMMGITHLTSEHSSSHFNKQQESQLSTTTPNLLGFPSASSSNTPTLLNISSIPNLTTSPPLSCASPNQNSNERTSLLPQQPHSSNATTPSFESSRSFLETCEDFSLDELSCDRGSGMPSLHNIQSLHNLQTLQNAKSSMVVERKVERDLLNEILAGISNEDRNDNNRDMADTTTPTSSTPTPTSRIPSVIDKKCNSIKGEIQLYLCRYFIKHPPLLIRKVRFLLAFCIS